MEAAILAENIRGLCFIPLAPDDRVIGTFMVYFSEPHVLDQNELELALIIARQRNHSDRSSRRPSRNDVELRDFSGRSRKYPVLLKSKD